MSVEFDRESLGKFDSRTLNRKIINRWTGRKRYDLGPLLISSIIRIIMIIIYIIIVIVIIIIMAIIIITIMIIMIITIPYYTSLVFRPLTTSHIYDCTVWRFCTCRGRKRTKQRPPYERTHMLVTIRDYTCILYMMCYDVCCLISPSLSIYIYIYTHIHIHIYTCDARRVGRPPRAGAPGRQARRARAAPLPQE